MGYAWNRQLNWMANFTWGIVDHILCDLYARRKYRDVIQPVTVLRRLDAVGEPTRQVVLWESCWRGIRANGSAGPRQEG